MQLQIQKKGDKHKFLWYDNIVGSAVNDFFYCFKIKTAFTIILLQLFRILRSAADAYFGNKVSPVRIRPC